MNDLKPCPFCGGESSLIKGIRNCYYEICYVQCNECQANGEKFEDKLIHIAKEKAITAWNKRVKCGEC